MEMASATMLARKIESTLTCSQNATVVMLTILLVVVRYQHQNLIAIWRVQETARTSVELAIVSVSTNGLESLCINGITPPATQEDRTSTSCLV